MLGRYAVMERSVAAGLDDGQSNMLLLQPTASRVLMAEREERLAIGGIHTRAAARALAVMHHCNSRGVVCAAPTGGSAGTVPGVVVSLVEEMDLSNRQTALALFAASAVGLIVARRATFAAEIAGCQVEIGVAGAMAAAAVVEAVGGRVRQAADAAAISLQNTMGSPCDPVAGACEVPCHTRNAVAASSAFTCADLILGGYANPIPLDEAIDASYEVGKALPSELRCTARGGCAVTPSALACDGSDSARIGAIDCCGLRSFSICVHLRDLRFLLTLPRRSHRKERHQQPDDEEERQEGHEDVAHEVARLEADPGTP